MKSPEITLKFDLFQFSKINVILKELYMDLCSSELSDDEIEKLIFVNHPYANNMLALMRGQVIIKTYHL